MSILVDGCRVEIQPMGRGTTQDLCGYVSIEDWLEWGEAWSYFERIPGEVVGGFARFVEDHVCGCGCKCGCCYGCDCGCGCGC